ncbi:MAG: hypothetical protein CMN05_11635 [Roseibacillus sp.]|jgi:type 1 glutamine amidotransferase|nr:hypothetical protein [Roseibacillus sp.]MBP34344.1 hypothetical protein [Roseibacillus sp.]|tara:strand:- start:21315 stop:22181 length:867 start_codon:yes stop_codon:yes gene_type:complete
MPLDHIMKLLLNLTIPLSLIALPLHAEPDPPDSCDVCSCNTLFSGGTTTVAQKNPRSDTSKLAPRQFDWGNGTKILIVGGHASHDFDRWFNKEDTRTLEKDPPISIHYTDRPQDILPALDKIDVLYLSQNQKMADEKTNKAIEAFANRGGGLVLVHAAIWNNWGNWPSYYRDLVGGWSRGHDRLGEFEVSVLNNKHPVTKGFPATFRITDELYYHNIEPKGNAIELLAQATSRNGKTYPTIWTVKHPKARILCMTLGHDGDSHQHEHFQTILRRAVKWVTPAGKPGDR